MAVNCQLPIGCCIAVAFRCWLMDVGHRYDCHMILEVVGCRVPVVGFGDLSGVVVT
jgi:hypothetical protein